MRRTIAGALAAGACLAAAALPSAATAALPPEMEYELVSPHASRGFEYTRTWLFPDGDRAIIGSEQSDVNGTYPVVRTAEGWRELGRRSVTPPNGEPLVAAGVADLSADSSRVLVAAVRKDPGPADIQGDRLAISEPDGSWTIVGNRLRYIDGSADLSRLIVQSHWTMSGDDEYPGLPGRETGVFLWEDDGSDDGTAIALGADEPRLTTCGAYVPADLYARAIEQTGVSRDADAVVMTSREGCVDPDDSSPLPSHLFHWRDGVTTDLTAPAIGADGASSFVGHDQDVRTVYFRTDLRLVSGDRNGAADVYRWDEATKKRTRITGAVTDAGETLTSELSSDDGSRVWFSTVDGDGLESLWTVARGESPRRIAQETEANDPGHATFDLRNSGNGSNNLGFMAQTTPDGTTLLWATRTRIDGQGGDTTEPGDAGQIFRATVDGEIECVSCLADGRPALIPMHGSGGRYEGFLLPNRVISDDGRWIAFQTPAALDPEDRNDLDDVYLWHDGERYLVTSGEEGHEGELGNMDARGNLFVKTRALLLPWIEDDHKKVYAVRTGGGFPAPPDPRQTCTGDGCQGAPGPRSEDPAPPSEGFRGPGDADDPAPPFPAKPSLKVGRASGAAKRALARGRAATLTVRSTARGRVTATVRFKRGRRWVKSSAGTRSVRAGRAARVTVRLSRAARAQLARRGALRVRIEVSHGSVAASRRIAFVLKRPAPSRGGARA